MAFFNRALVIVRGGGDLASGAIFRLHRAGFPVVVTELAAPLLVRRTVSFGEAVYSRTITVEGVTARHIAGVDAVVGVIETDEVAVLVDPDGQAIKRLRPVVIVDARMEKANLGTTIHDAPMVVGLGPGFVAGVDCHAVVETNRGHNLGRALFDGLAEPDTGEPGSIGNQTVSRILRAPASGHVRSLAQIGDTVEEGVAVAEVAGLSVVAAFTGVLRGLIHERVAVTEGMKIGDLDPRARRENCFTISDKALAVGGGVLEAVLASPQVRAYLQPGDEAQRGA